jgi:FkbM family methyltransferase
MINYLKRRLKNNFPKLATNYFKLIEHLDRNDPFIKTQWGFYLSGNSNMATGLFEIEETEKIRELILESEIVINIGANIGYYSCHALSLGKQVIAFEPVQRNLHYLLRNIEKNGWKNDIEIFPVALGVKNDILKIWGTGTAASLVKGWAKIYEDYYTLVPVLPLDTILCSRVKNKKVLYIIDVEGAEYQVLMGAKKILNNSSDSKWVIEITSTENQPSGLKMNPYLLETFKLFIDSGYIIHSIDEKNEIIDLYKVKAVMDGSDEFSNYNFIMSR